MKRNKYISTRGWVGFGVGALALLGAIQFVPYGHDRVNPGIETEPAWDSPQTRALVKRVCFDCHSNETRWPVYSRVAPVSWLVQHDVVEGRAALNFSEWQRPHEEAAEASDVVREREMPPLMYRLMHAEARLRDEDLIRLVRGLVLTLGTHGTSGQEGRSAVPQAAAGNLARSYRNFPLRIDRH